MIKMFGQNKENKKTNQYLYLISQFLLFQIFLTMMTLSLWLLQAKNYFGAVVLLVLALVLEFKGSKDLKKLQGEKNAK